MIEEQKVSDWIWIGALTFTFVIIGLNIFMNFQSNGEIGFGYALGISFPSFIVFIVAWLCAKKCVKWAREIDNTIEGLNTAFIIGFLFGIFGWLGYGFYYKHKMKEKKE